MVRLKGKSRIAKGYENLISIPYGAIKRAIIFCEEQVSDSFQFLMVRLKGYAVFTRDSAEEISIPYGAIKS